MSKRCFIQFAWRHNLMYPSLLIIWTLLRKINILILDKGFDFSKNVLFTLLMFVGEIFAGLLLSLYQKISLKKKDNNEATQNLLINIEKMRMPHSKIKIAFLIFVIGFFDFIEYILSTNYNPKFINSSISLDIRLGGILTIISALFFYYLLKLPIVRHQFFSIYIIGLCFIVTILLEYYFQDVDIIINYRLLTLKILLIFLEQFFLATLNSIEKYVVEYNNLDYFKVLALEGVFGSLITLPYLFVDNSYINQLNFLFKNKSGAMLFLFIFLLIVYIVLCGLKNAYKVLTNKFYSPMTISLTDYFLNPIYLIENYIEGDFISGEKQNFFYFFISFILCIITDICGCVFNEIIILFFCDLEIDTYNQVSRRSSFIYQKELSEINKVIEDENNI